ncbi:MAG TPA: hypothetical protein DIV86_06405, partial [Alphaproteobacteria bacterium]|nr:hypothetical protein [Alphaproteobacteria bacterium]
MLKQVSLQRQMQDATPPTTPSAKQDDGNKKPTIKINGEGKLIYLETLSSSPNFNLPDNLIGSFLRAFLRNGGIGEVNGETYDKNNSNHQEVVNLFINTLEPTLASRKAAYLGIKKINGVDFNPLIHEHRLALDSFIEENLGIGLTTLNSGF